MAKKQKEVTLVPTYGYMTNDEGTIDLITILYNPDDDTVEIDRETQNYKEAHRAIFDLQQKISKNFITQGKK